VDLLLGERAELVEDLSEALALGGGLGPDDVALLEEDRALGDAVEHDQLTLPARVADEGHDVAEGALRDDLAAELHDRPVVLVALAVLANEAHENDVVGAWHQPEGTLAGAELLAGGARHRMCGPRIIDAHEVGRC